LWLSVEAAGAPVQPTGSVVGPSTKIDKTAYAWLTVLLSLKRKREMHLNRFGQGDKVSYAGEKFAKDLHGKLGIICGRIGGTEHGVVVDFGEDSYVMDEERHLVPFQGKLRSETPEGGKDEKKRGGVEVHKRRKTRPAEGESEE
jgi:hypothetical protein